MVDPVDEPGTTGEWGVWEDLGACGSDEPCTCVDEDGDGYGATVCENCTYGALDCNDSDAAVNPGVDEAGDGNPVCSDGVDNDCDSLIDDQEPACAATITCVDLDGDGYGSPADASCDSPLLDCDDTDAEVNPGATEIYGDGIDNDCNGEACGTLVPEMNLSIANTVVNMSVLVVPFAMLALARRRRPRRG